jgi:hypothetical protein
MVRVFVLLGVAAAACNDANTPPPPTATPAFEAVAHSPADGAIAYLNDPITVSFTTQLDLDTVNPSSFALEELDANGVPTLVATSGTYRLANNGTMLWWQPDLPMDGAYQTGGLRQNRSYHVLVTDSLHDTTGQRLQAPRSFWFRTRSGQHAADLFRDRDVNGPSRSGLIVPSDRSTLPVDGVRLQFDQPLDPEPTNYSTAVWLDYTTASGVLFLPGTVELESNTEFGATLVLRPNWILPPGHTARVQVSAELRDLSGQNNTQTPDYSTVFGTFDT